jgi:hypothetical protein
MGDQSFKDISARKFMVVMFTMTYCLLHIANAMLAVLNYIKVETYLALWGSFTPVMLLIAEWYFKRDDRKKEGA